MAPVWFTITSWAVVAGGVLASNHIGAPRSFVIQDDKFVKDGEEFTIRSGSLHYFRVPRAYWRDRMQRIKALGLNSITTYLAWNVHEEIEGQFHGLNKITEFLEIAKEEGLLVLVRPGPYICAEWDFGGFPAYLLAKESIMLRTWSPVYIAAVNRWFEFMLPAVSPYLYSRGGPIIMVQIENEFGQWGNCAENPDDAKYMEHLLSLMTAHLGHDVIYFTNDYGVSEKDQIAVFDKSSPWKGDARVLATIDFLLCGQTGCYDASFAGQKAFNAPGNSPKMIGELWGGWFLTWGLNYSHDWDGKLKTSTEIRAGMSQLMTVRASFSLYMAHGGTNFGFGSGANPGVSALETNSVEFLPYTTSYDYFAPISEAGGHNIGSDGGDLFEAVRQALAAEIGELPTEPEPPQVRSLGIVTLDETAFLFGNLHSLSSCNVDVPQHQVFPSMEDLLQPHGLLLYRCTNCSFQAQSLTFSNKTLHDRVQVFVDDHAVGDAYRIEHDKPVHVPAGKNIDLLVENMGHVAFGNRTLNQLKDYKGLLMAPPFEGNWSAVCLPLDEASVLSLAFEKANKTEGKRRRDSPVFKRGRFHIAGNLTDTFLDTYGFTKGYIWVNGHALGRYWETLGPEHTLYLPGPFLRNGSNEIIILDLHGSAAKAIHSVARPRDTPDYHSACNKKASVGTCLLVGCFLDHGPAHCSGTQCICNEGFCSTDGWKCLPDASREAGEVILVAQQAGNATSPTTIFASLALSSVFTFVFCYAIRGARVRQQVLVEEPLLSPTQRHLVRAG